MINASNLRIFFICTNSPYIRTLLQNVLIRYISLLKFILLYFGFSYFFAKKLQKGPRILKMQEPLGITILLKHPQFTRANTVFRAETAAHGP